MTVDFNKIKSFVSNNKFLCCLLLLSLLSSLRALILPLKGDEITYAEIAKNIILKGKYYFNGAPSTVTPSIPLIIAFFYTKFNPIFGYALAKLLNLGLIVIGLKYLHSFLIKLNVSEKITWALLILCIVNTNFIAWSLALYPEAILFCFFWMFIYYATCTITKPKDIVPLVLAFMVLVITRYLYAVCGLIILITIYPYLKKQLLEKGYTNLLKITGYTIACMIPLLFWFKYVYQLEKEVDLGLSYFTRFKNDDSFYNIKAGLGLIKHHEVARVNGIPAFTSLFVPITGFRNWISSIILIAMFAFGFITKMRYKNYNIIFLAILLVMLGLVFAGTGFSRYWLILLPGFLLGFYQLWNYLKLKDMYFIYISYAVSILYVLNELRLNYLILNPYL